MEFSNKEHVVQYLIASKLATHQDDVRIDQLDGGVSSDVVHVQISSNSFVLKRALPKLRVEEEWNVSTDRGLTEIRCLELLNTIIPGSVPVVLFADEKQCLFAMEHIDHATTWKQDLLKGHVNLEVTRKTAQLLADIHRITYQNPQQLYLFKDKKLFYDLRIYPYFLFIKNKYPFHCGLLDEVVEQMMEANHVLVHGDFSPKNILIRHLNPVILDCEVAHAGHPSFDIAFLLSHLLLKSVHFPDKQNQYLIAAKEFYNTYYQCVGVIAEKDYRMITLQTAGALMLARIDGKSPVEYLTDTEQEESRSLGIRLLEKKITDLDSI